MKVFIKTSTDKPGLWFVFCRDPCFYLGPYPSEQGALEIQEALHNAYHSGQRSIQEPMRELLGLQNVGD